MIEKAISVRSPWWWSILHDGKDIENRDWSTKFRGTVYLHASKWFREREVVSDWQLAFRVGMRQGMPDRWPDKLAFMKRCGGHIVGQVDIVDCVEQSESRWFFGDYGFVLENAVAYAKPVPCKGALGFFNVAKIDPAAAEMLKGVR